MANPDPGIDPDVTVGAGAEAEDEGAMDPMLPLMAWADARVVFPGERARAAISPARRKEE
jgi:hypothetical protein